MLASMTSVVVLYIFVRYHISRYIDLSYRDYNVCYESFDLFLLIYYHVLPLFASIVKVRHVAILLV